MPELRNVSADTVFVPGLDITLEPNVAVEITADQAAEIHNPALVIDGKTSVSIELGQVAAVNEVEPTAEHVDQTPSEKDEA